MSDTVNERVLKLLSFAEDKDLASFSALLDQSDDIKRLIQKSEEYNQLNIETLNNLIKTIQEKENESIEIKVEIVGGEAQTIEHEEND